MKKVLKFLLESKVLSGALKYSSASAFTKVLMFLLLPVWTAYLSPEDFGIVGTVRAYTMLLIPFVAMGVPAAVIRQYHDVGGSSEVRWAGYFSSNIYFLVGVSITVTVAGLLLGPSVWSEYVSSEIAFSPYFQIVLLGVPLMVFLQMIQANFKARQEHSVAVLIDLTNNLGMILVGLVLVVGCKAGAAGYLAAFAIASVFVSIRAYVKKVRHLLVFKFSWDDVKVSLKYGLPLVPHIVAGVVFSVSDRIMLERMRGLEDVGVYNLAFQFSQLIVFLVIATNQSWSPRFYQIMNSGDQGKITFHLKRYVCWWVAFFSLACGVLILCGDYMVILLTPEPYHNAGKVLPLLALGSFFQGFYFIGVNPLFFFKKTSLIPALTVTTAVCNISLNYLLIPQYGSMGAAMGTLATFLIVAVITNIVGYKYCPVAYPFYWLLLLVAGVVALVGVSLSIELKLHEELMIRVAALCCLGLLVWRFLVVQGLFDFKVNKLDC